MTRKRTPGRGAPTRSPTATSRGQAGTRRTQALSMGQSVIVNGRRVNFVRLAPLAPNPKGQRPWDDPRPPQFCSPRRAVSWDMRPQFCEKEVTHKSLPQFWDLQKETCLPRPSSLRKASQFCFKKEGACVSEFPQFLVRGRQKEATFTRELPQFCQLQLCDELEGKSRVQRDREMDSKKRSGINMKFDVESGMMDDGYERDSDAVKFKLESEKVLVSSRGLSSSCFYFPPPLPRLPPTILEFSDTQDSSMPVFRELGINSATSDDSGENVIVLGWFVLPFVDTNLFQSLCEAVCARSSLWAVDLRVRAIPQAEGINFLTNLPNVVSVDVDLCEYGHASKTPLRLVSNIAALSDLRALLSPGQTTPARTSRYHARAGKALDTRMVGYVFKCAMRSAWQASKSTTQAVERIKILHSAMFTSGVDARTVR